MQKEKGGNLFTCQSSCDDSKKKKKKAGKAFRMVQTEKINCCPPLEIVSHIMRKIKRHKISLHLDIHRPKMLPQSQSFRTNTRPVLCIQPMSSLKTSHIIYHHSDQNLTPGLKRAIVMKKKWSKQRRLEDFCSPQPPDLLFFGQKFHFVSQKTKDRRLVSLTKMWPKCFAQCNSHSHR